MNKMKIFAVTSLLLFALCIGTAYATPPPEFSVTDPGLATVANVWTTDVNGNVKLQFQLGETVYIHWTANGLVNIAASGPSGPDGNWIDQPAHPTPAQIIAWVPTQGVGYYSVTCTGAQTKVVAYGTILVVPQIPLGILAAVGSCFAAFGVVKFRKTKKN